MIVLFNKPYGVLSQFKPHHDKKTLAEFELPKGVYPCGRLDHDSEGLLILSDDGRLQSRLCEPRFKTPRTYLAQVERIPNAATLARLERGLILKDGPSQPCRAKLMTEPTLWPRVPPIRFRKNVPTAWLEIILCEGRNRQVRRMTAAIGHPTLRLIRVSHGPFSLANLRPGEWKISASAPNQML